MLMQLQKVYLSHNQLVGSLPEAWSNLTSVSPISELDDASPYGHLHSRPLVCQLRKMLTQATAALTLPELCAYCAPACAPCRLVTA